ncbi:cytochrome P450 [Bdellovibrio sp. 22V]|uniref:cytochrome P450 n=1 Tax=Bdellovibrio sp. 22V TaxID=3044166 RepID=UPI0025437CC0|nr:cytochrome P450 [Bdellovibrio sp. 22V]WII70662.1 cytochrome P450 [Bdellovibrio sp. 22V]
MAQQIPQAAFDSTVSLLRDPYHFISRTCQDMNTPVFQTRVLLRNTICMTGVEAAQFFYDEKNFIRKGGMPEPIVATLLGKKGVQSLDDVAHRHRKKMFMSFMTDESVQKLVLLTEKHWDKTVPVWMKMKHINLYDEYIRILTQSVCEWAGIPLEPAEVSVRSEDLRAMFDDAGSAGLRHLHSRRARKNAEAWISNIIRQVRKAQRSVEPNSPVGVIAWHQEMDGRLLDDKTAAVEILNLLRPTVAVAVYLTFATHALYVHPECRAKVHDDTYLDYFVQEIRRFYPFFPAVAAKVREDIEWQGYSFKKGTRTILDLYGINHDANLWYEPRKFIPERFATWNGSPYSFVPQGGGDHYTQHRCPGEKITLELLRMATRYLRETISYAVPRQDFQLEENRLPALPRSRFIISHVQLKLRPSEHPQQYL